MTDIAQNDSGRLEYRVRPITRYVITRYDESAPDEHGNVSAGTAQRGVYENADVAWEVAYALCKMEHERYGYPVDDERIQYPRHPNEPRPLPAPPAE